MPLSELCAETGVRLLAYGTLCGGFLADKWLGRPEPTAIPDWSRSKYKRFIDAAGGWGPFQGILAAAGEVARKHGVSISNVATRWVLEQPAVAAVIVGARITESEHRADNRRSSASRSTPRTGRGSTPPSPRRRRSPATAATSTAGRRILTASGDLSHHLDACRASTRPSRCRAGPGGCASSSGSVWEPIAGYSRAVRDRRPDPRLRHHRHPRRRPLRGAGRRGRADDLHPRQDRRLDSRRSAAGLEDVVRTRIYVRDAADWEPVSRAHGRVFGAIRPANTLVEVAGLVGDYEVEIEAEAVVG